MPRESRATRPAHSICSVLGASMVMLIFLGFLLHTVCMTHSHTRSALPRHTPSHRQPCTRARAHNDGRGETSKRQAEALRKRNCAGTLGSGFESLARFRSDRSLPAVSCAARALLSVGTVNLHTPLDPSGCPLLRKTSSPPACLSGHDWSGAEGRRVIRKECEEREERENQSPWAS